MAERSPDVDAYLAAHPEGLPHLQMIRAALHAGLPIGEETVRYGMPAIMLGRRYAVHFAGWKQHAGLYPVPDLGDVLEEEVAPLRSGKDTVKILYRQPVPEDLITRIAARILELKDGRQNERSTTAPDAVPAQEDRCAPVHGSASPRG